MRSSNEKEEKVYMYRGPKRTRRWGTRSPDGGSYCDAREGLYALSLVLCGSHGFQAGIFSADRQRGQNRRTQAKEREEAACHRPRIFWCIASPFSAYLNDTIVLYQRSDIGASRAGEKAPASFSLSAPDAVAFAASSFTNWDRSFALSRSGSNLPSNRRIGPLTWRKHRALSGLRRIVYEIPVDCFFFRSLLHPGLQVSLRSILNLNDSRENRGKDIGEIFKIVTDMENYFL